MRMQRAEDVDGDVKSEGRQGDEQQKEKVLLK